MTEPRQNTPTVKRSDDEEDLQMPKGSLITVCVRLLLGADRDAVAAKVVGKRGTLCPKDRPAIFWAETAMHLKQIEALEGVKYCTLSPMRW